MNRRQNSFRLSGSYEEALGSSSLSRNTTVLDFYIYPLQLLNRRLRFHLQALGNNSTSQHPHLRLPKTVKKTKDSQVSPGKQT